MVDSGGVRGQSAAPESCSMPTEAAVKAEETLIHVLWINAGLSCDGDSVALTAATQPSVEEIALGALPGLPKVAVHWPLIDFECGHTGGADDFIEWFFKADRGELEPFVLIVEGSIPNESIKREGYWAAFGKDRKSTRLNSSHTVISYAVFCLKKKKKKNDNNNQNKSTTEI